MSNNFSDDQVKLLEKYVTNLNKNIFAIHNLPEVVKGALFSRYSRSNMGLRELLLKEFLDCKMMCDDEQAPLETIQKAQSFYDRVLDGFGDDSIGELGGAHLALENISILAAKAIEDCRIGGSPLEKSTRYIYFDQKVDGEFLYYKEPIVLASAYKKIYLETCNFLFETYAKLIPPLTALLEKDLAFNSSEISKQAYVAALRAKVLDCLRGLLPSSALTNMGVFGNGRFFEQLLHKLASNNLSEMQSLHVDIFEELNKLIPSFVRRADSKHKSHISYIAFYEKQKQSLRSVTKTFTDDLPQNREATVVLVNYSADAIERVATSLLFEHSNVSLEDLQKRASLLADSEITQIFNAASEHRENRRHKSPRGLENAEFTFEIIADFGIYRDLQRHRLLSQERQLLTCSYDYYIPKEILNTEMEKDYRNAMAKAKQTYDIIAEELPEEAQYVVPMGYRLRWYFHLNLRQIQWMCELRSSPQGHPNYRYIAQEIVKQVCQVFPAFNCFFKFVDFEGYDLGRLNQETKRLEKMRIEK